MWSLSEFIWMIRIIHVLELVKNFEQAKIHIGQISFNMILEPIIFKRTSSNPVQFVIYLNIYQKEHVVHVH